jgi:hypothetical protein
MAPSPRCEALLRDGGPCGRTVASDSKSFCIHHAELELELGADALRQGRYPPRKNLKAAPIVVATSGKSDATTENITAETDPARVRPKLAEAAAESFDDIRRTLLDAATSASKPAWVEFECGECGTHRRVDVPVPDVRARVAAIELLLREGLGRAPQAEEAPVPRLPESIEAVRKMSWRELQQLAATFYLETFVAAQRYGTEALLRDRVAVLGSDMRRVLREALA